MNLLFLFNFVLFNLSMLCDCYSPWLFMSNLQGEIGPHICDQLPLTKKQRAICLEEPKSLEMVQTGVDISISECKFQFQHERWNCTSGTKNTHAKYGKLIETVPGTRESAFVYAITSAAVAYRITIACSEGLLKQCSCDPKKRGIARDHKGMFEWAGCSDHISYGIGFAEKFLNSMESDQSDATSIVNKHNNEIGRKAVKRFFNRRCRCHGPSSSCTTRTCFEILQDFRKTGDYLKEKYNRASMIQIQKNGTVMKVGKKRNNINKNNLYYLERSPNYCNSNPSKGSLGTGGRRCNVTSSGSDNCDVMCCGRGHVTTEVRVASECDCKFIWCCNVTCSTCYHDYQLHTCKYEPDIVMSSQLPVTDNNRNNRQRGGGGGRGGRGRNRNGRRRRGRKNSSTTLTSSSSTSSTGSNRGGGENPTTT